MDVLDGNMVNAVTEYLTPWGAETDIAPLADRIQFYMNKYDYAAWASLAVADKNELWANAWNDLFPEAAWDA